MEKFKYVMSFKYENFKNKGLTEYFTVRATSETLIGGIAVYDDLFMIKICPEVGADGSNTLFKSVRYENLTKINYSENGMKRYSIQCNNYTKETIVGTLRGLAEKFNIPFEDGRSKEYEMIAFRNNVARFKVLARNEEEAMLKAQEMIDNDEIIIQECMDSGIEFALQFNDLKIDNKEGEIEC